MLANVPNPASSALDDGKQLRFEQASRPGVERGPIERVQPRGQEGEHVQRPQQRCASGGVERHQQRHPRKHHVGDDHEPAPVHRVGGRTPDDREHEDGHQLDQTEHADREDRARDREDLERHDHLNDRVAEVRHAVADEQAAVLARYPQRRHVYADENGRAATSLGEAAGPGGVPRAADPRRGDASTTPTESLTIERMFGIVGTLSRPFLPRIGAMHGGTKRTAPRLTSCTSRRSPYPPRRGASAVPRTDRRCGSGCPVGRRRRPRSRALALDALRHLGLEGSSLHRRGERVGPPAEGHRGALDRRARRRQGGRAHPVRHRRDRGRIGRVGRSRVGRAHPTRGRRLAPRRDRRGRARRRGPRGVVVLSRRRPAIRDACRAARSSGRDGRAGDRSDQRDDPADAR